MPVISMPQTPPYLITYAVTFLFNISILLNL